MGNPLQMIGTAPQQDAFGGLFEGTEGWVANFAGALEGGVEQDFDLGTTGSQAAKDMGQGVEVGWALEAGFEQIQRLDTVEAKDAQAFAQTAVACGVPAAFVHDDTVGLDDALAQLPAEGLITQADLLALLDGLTEGRDGFEGGWGLIETQMKADGGLQGLGAGVQGGGHHALGLGQGAHDSGFVDGQTQVANRHQAQDEGDCFLVGEHQGGHLEAAAEPVATAGAGFGFDGDAHLLQADEVAADGAPVDFEAAGELGAADAGVGLE